MCDVVTFVSGLTTVASMCICIYKHLNGDDGGADAGVTVVVN